MLSLIVSVCAGFGLVTLALLGFYALVARAAWWDDAD